jgi:hypothetical protein
MEPKTISRIDEMAGMEKALAVATKAAASRIAEPDVSGRLRSIGERHEQQAEALENARGGGGMGDMAAEGSVVRAVERARGTEAIMDTLRQAEYEQAERYSDAEGSIDDQQVRMLFTEHLRAFEEDRDVWEQSPGSKEVADPSRLP